MTIKLFRKPTHTRQCRIGYQGICGIFPVPKTVFICHPLKMRLHSSVLKDLTGLELYPAVIFINVDLRENSIAIYKVKERWAGLFGGGQKETPILHAIHTDHRI